MWAMGHGDEVAVVDSRYVIDQGGYAEVHRAVAQMGDDDILGMYPDLEPDDLAAVREWATTQAAGASSSAG